MDMSEHTIQNALYDELSRKGHAPIVPNCSLYEWESDLVSVTRAGYAYEYEVKVSRADFFRDQHKDRHRYLSWMHGATTKRSGKVPRHFYYVVPAGLVAADEVPVYAGLVEVSPAGRVRTVRRAPALTQRTLSEAQMLFLARGLMYRYWQSRT